MKQSESKGRKLITYLRAMDSDTRREFHGYLSSPLLGKSPQFATMLYILEEEALAGEKSTIDFGWFAEVIRPGEPMGPQKEKYIGIRLSQLQQKVYDFLAFKGFEKRPGLQAVLMLEQSIRRGNDLYLENLYQKMRLKLESPQSTDEFLHLLLLEEQMNNHLVNHAVNPGRNHLDQLEKALDQYLVLQKLKYGCANLVERRLGAQPRQSNLLTFILEAVEADLDNYPALIRCYYHVYRMLDALMRGEEGHEAEFRTFLALWKDDVIARLPEARDLFILGQNYCILQMQNGNLAYQEDLGELYVIALYSGIFDNANYLSPAGYKNCIEVLCKVGLISKAEEMCLLLKKAIHPLNRELAFTYNQAVIRFFEGEYESVVEKLIPLLGKLNHLGYSFGARVYLARALFGMQDYERLLTSLHAFAQFIVRQQDSRPGEAEVYRRFISYLKKLVMAISSPNGEKEERLERLAQSLEENEEANRFGWLRRTLDRIRNEGN